MNSIGNKNGIDRKIVIFLSMIAAAGCGDGGKLFEKARPDEIPKIFRNISSAFNGTDSCNNLSLSSAQEDYYDDSENEGWKEKERDLSESEWAIQDPAIKSFYQSALATARMYNDDQSISLARGKGLDVTPVTWEDTGRYKNSSVGPNISDMTIQVRVQDPRFHANDYKVLAMPVIRYPNYSDLTADVGTSNFGLLVGNQNGSDLKKIALFDFLNNPSAFLSDPGSWPSAAKSLLAPRDTHVLVSAQAAMLPVPQQGIAQFNPVLFNYQSSKGSPAVLTILATREGTSVTIIDNTRDAWSDGAIWGQRLFHNKKGERTSLTAQREEEFKKDPNNKQEVEKAESAGQKRNMVLLIQVPLKNAAVDHQASGQGYYGEWEEDDGSRCRSNVVAKSSKADAKEMPQSAEDAGMDNAVIGHGPVEGPFTEIDGLAIERDPRFPVRVTVQFYKATATGKISQVEMDQIHADIKSVYDAADVVGSLVVGGETGRVTEYEGLKVQPAGWWSDFWTRHKANTGEDKETAIGKLKSLFGDGYQDRSVSELYLAKILAVKK